MKKITIIYADDLKSLEGNPLQIRSDRVVSEQEFHNIPQSRRIDWVENLCQDTEEDKIIAIITNDYWLMRLVQNFTTEDRFSIYSHDSDQHVSRFVDLKPNPTLVVGEFVFRTSVREALKKLENQGKNNGN